ncbi:MAG: PIG-L deacetylase family protein [Terriglobales bacterium]
MSEIEEKTLRRLLVVTAHPDDEAGGFGGTLLLSRERGIETYVVCLTPGQAASNRGGAKSDDELSAMRRVEFARSCEMLKVTRGEVLNYRDGALDKANFLEVVGELTRRIREIRPQVMATFGPEGAITGHPDHSMASLFATAAFHWAGRTKRFAEQLNNGTQPHRVQKLYYASPDFNMQDREPVTLPPWTAKIAIGKRLDTKLAAFKTHTSQAPLFERVDKTFRQHGEQELFHLAAAYPPREMKMEEDLFEGIEE